MADKSCESYFIEILFPLAVQMAAKPVYVERATHSGRDKKATVDLDLG
jgi:hypothetical protein